MVKMPSARCTSGGRLLAAVVLLAALGGAVRADVEPIATWEWVTDAEVAASAADGDTVYLGGAFRYMAAVARDGASFVTLDTGDAADGCATRTGPQGGLGTPVVADAGGGLFMQTPLDTGELVDEAGTFAVDPAHSFVRVGADCRFDRAFRLGPFIPGDPLARGASIVRGGDVVYVGGSRANGATDRFGRLAAFNPSTGGIVGAWDYPQFDVVRLEGVAPNGLLVVSVPPRGAPNGPYPIGLLNPATGAFTSLAPGAATGFVKVIGTALYVSAGPGQPLQAVDLATGQPRAGWTSPAVTVTDIEAADGRLFVAGSGLGRVGVFALAEATGALVPAFEPALTTRPGDTVSVERLAIVGSRLFLRGAPIRGVDGQERFRLAAVDTSSGAVDPWAPMLFATMLPEVDLVPNGERLYVGRLLSETVEHRQYLAAVDTFTGEVLPFDPASTPGAAPVPPVTSLALNADYLLIGTAEGQIRRASLDTGRTDAWGVLTSAAGHAHGAIAALAATDTVVYAGGFFDAAVTSSVPQSAGRGHGLAVEIATATLTDWDPLVVSTSPDPASSPAPIAALSIEGEAVLIGGRFSSVGGQPRNGLAVVDMVAGGPLLPEVTLAAGDAVSDLARGDGETYFVGTGSSPLIGTARVDQATVTTWTVPTLPAGSTPTARVAAFSGLVYSGPEWDPTTAAPTSSAVRWTSPGAAADGLVERHAVIDGDPHAIGVRFHAAESVTTPRSPRLLEVQYANQQVYLTWVAPTAGDVESYVIRAGSSSGQSNLAEIDTGSTATAFAVTAPEGAYFVRVHARGALGLSPPSNEVAFALAPHACNRAPAAPGTLSGTGYDIGAVLAWGPAPGATSYRVEAGSAPGQADLAVIGVGPALGYATLAPPGVYVVRVRGINGCGVGAASNEVALQVGGPPPGAPADLQATVSGGTVTLTWAAPPAGPAATYYRLEAGTGPGVTDLATAVSNTPAYVATNVPPGTYFVRVRAGNTYGLGPPTADLIVSVP